MTIRGIMLRTLFVAVLCWWACNPSEHMRLIERVYGGSHLLATLTIGGLIWIEFELLVLANKKEEG